MALSHTLGAIARCITPGQTHRHLHPIAAYLFPDAAGAGWRKFDFADAALIAVYIEMRRAGLSSYPARVVCNSAITRLYLRDFLALPYVDGTTDPAADPLAWFRWIELHNPMIVALYTIDGDVADRRAMEIGISVSPFLVKAARLADVLADRSPADSVFATPILPAFKALLPLLLEQSE